MADWYGPYSAAPPPDPPGPDTGDLRVLRGGAWKFPLTSLRGSFRWMNAPDGTSDGLSAKDTTDGFGIRCGKPL